MTSRFPRFALATASDISDRSYGHVRGGRAENTSKSSPMRLECPSRGHEARYSRDVERPDVDAVLLLHRLRQLAGAAPALPAPRRRGGERAAGRDRARREPHLEF